MLPSADQLFKDADFIFRHDLAPAHTAKSTKSWLNEHGVGVLDWPANLADLNPIENLEKMRNKRPKNAVHIQVQCKVYTVSDGLGWHVICWCWSTVFSEVQGQHSRIPGSFRALHASCCWPALWRCRFHFSPAHSAKATSTWFKDHGIPVLNWPANSPYLNPIENIWGIVKRKMGYARPNNAEELKATIRATWALITPEQCHRLIDSMPRRIAAVIQAKEEVSLILYIF